MTIETTQIIAAVSGWALFFITLLVKSFSSGVKIGELTKRLVFVEEELKAIKNQMEALIKEKPAPRPCPDFIELRTDYKHTQEKYYEDTKSIAKDIATIKTIVERMDKK